MSANGEAPQIGTVAFLAGEGVTVGLGKKLGTGEQLLLVGPITLVLPVSPELRKVLLEELSGVIIAQPGDVQL